MGQQYPSGRLSLWALASSFAFACAVDADLSGRDDGGERVVDGDGQVDWRTIVDNAEQNNGFRFNGFRFNGFRFNGFRFNGFRFNGFRFNGEELANVNIDGNILRGEDPQGGLHSGVELDGARFDVDFVDPEDPGNTATLEFELSGAETTSTGLVLSTVRHRELPGGDWVNSCENGAKAVLLQGDWDLQTGQRISAGSDALTFACLGAALGDCATWGYIPGELYNNVSLDAYHEACTRLKRADYCGDGTHHTENGHIIDVYDAQGIQTPVTVGSWNVEAMWGPNGAICASMTRLRDYTTDSASQTNEFIGCEVPACEDVNQDGVIDFLDYPTAVLANRTQPDWRTRDFTVYAFFRMWQGLYLRTSTNGGNTFGDPVEVTASYEQAENFPKVSVDDAGFVHLVFARMADAVFSELQHSVSTDGGATFSVPQKISTETGALQCAEETVGTSDMFRYEVLHDTSGHLHVFFNQESAGVIRLFHTVSTDAGATWTTPTLLDSAAEESWLRRVLVDSAGVLHLLYGEKSGGLWGVHYRRSSDGGSTWSAPSQINDSLNTSFSADIVLDSANNPHIAYEERDATFWSRLYYRSSSDGGATFLSPSAALDTSLCNEPGLCNIESVNILLDSSEHPHIAYERHFWDAEYLVYVRSSDGLTFDAPVDVAPTRTENWSIHNVRFFLSADDAPMIAWEDMTDGIGVFAGYYSRSTDGGLSFEPVTRVSEVGSSWGAVYEFDAVQGPDGNPYFVYSQSDELNQNLLYFKNSASFGDLLSVTVPLSDNDWDKFPLVCIK